MSAVIALWLPTTRSDACLTEPPRARQRAPRSCAFVLTGEEPYRFIVHDRDAMFSPAVADALRSMNLRVLKTPVRVPQANAFCERLIGTARRECLDHVIPLHERQLRTILAAWVPHYNRGRPYASLGPGIPEPPTMTWHERSATTFRRDIGLSRNQFSPGSITSTGLKHSRHDFLRTTTPA